MRISFALPRVLLLVLCASSPLVAQRSRTAPARAERPAWPDEGPATWTRRATAAPITANDLRTRLYQFADDSMQGRRIGEEGNFKGTEYIAREFRRLGLRPAGDSGTYFQTLPYGSVGLDTTTFRFVAGSTPLAPRTSWVPLAGSAGNGVAYDADLRDAPTIFGGSAGDTSALDPATYGGKVIVLVARPNFGLPQVFGGNAGRGAFDPPSCDSLPDRFGAAAAVIADRAAARADSIAGRGRFARGRVALRDIMGRARRAGARGVMLVSLDSVTPQSLDLLFERDDAMQPSTTDGLPAMAITWGAAETLLGASPAMLRTGAAGQPLSASWRTTFVPARWPARNVIAVLPGSDPTRAGEYVLVSAHNDHVGTMAAAVDHDSLRAVNTVTRRQGANDRVCRPNAGQQHRIDSMIAHARRMRPPRRDSIMNGADDDGSGTVVMLEIAEQFAAEKPARSIVFVSHQGEEAGMLGSQWFTNHPTIPLAQVVAAHNMDMVGKGRVEQVKFGGPASIQILGARRIAREFGDVIDSVNAVRPEVMAIDKTWEVPANPMNRFCRSDQVSYVAKDVPVAYFSLGYAQDYHQPTDEPRYIDYEHSARVGRFIHDVMQALANRRDRPSRSDPDLTMPRCGR